MTKQYLYPDERIFKSKPMAHKANIEYGLKYKVVDTGRKNFTYKLVKKEF